MILDYIVLGLLRQPASGYDLKTIFDERINYFWTAELSQIYPTLQRMEKKGWLKSRQANAKRGATRRVYETTPAGRRALCTWLETGPEVVPERFAYLAQIYLLHELDDARKSLQFFSRLRDGFATKLEALRRIERYWSECDPAYPDAMPLSDFHIQLTLRKGLLSNETNVQWCEESMQRIRTRLEKENQNAKPVPRTALAAHRRG